MLDEKRRKPFRSYSMRTEVINEIPLHTLETCHEATGLVIVIDVIRASRMRLCFAGGVEKIHPVAKVGERSN